VQAAPEDLVEPKTEPLDFVQVKMEPEDLVVQQEMYQAMDDPIADQSTDPIVDLITLPMVTTVTTTKYDQFGQK
jgi:hypothetical protein